MLCRHIQCVCVCGFNVLEGFVVMERLLVCIFMSGKTKGECVSLLGFRVILSKTIIIKLRKLSSRETRPYREHNGKFSDFFF